MQKKDSDFVTRALKRAAEAEVLLNAALEQRNLMRQVWRNAADADMVLALTLEDLETRDLMRQVWKNAADEERRMDEMFELDARAELDLLKCDQVQYADFFN